MNQVLKAKLKCPWCCKFLVQYREFRYEFSRAERITVARLWRLLRDELRFQIFQYRKIKGPSLPIFSAMKKTAFSPPVFSTEKKKSS